MRDCWPSFQHIENRNQQSQVAAPVETILEEIAEHAAKYPNWLELSAP